MQLSAPWSEYTASGPARDQAGGALYIAPDEQPEGARVWFFTRIGGVSESPYDSLNVSTRVGDELEAVDRNLNRIGLAMGEPPTAWVKQVSGDRVLRVNRDGMAGEADALITGEEDLALTIAVADCVPVVLTSRHEVAIVHSGWRGTLSEISSKAVRGMKDGPVRAYIGPGIRRCCYEVSEALANKFAQKFGDDVVEGRYLSLPAAIRRDLENIGIDDIQDLGVCTGCRPDLFYSHRKQGPHTGRNLAAVVRR